MRNKRIIEVLNKAGKNQTDLSNRLKISRATVSERLNSEKEIDSISFIKAVADLTGLSVCDLIKDEDLIGVVNEPLVRYQNTTHMSYENEYRRALEEIKDTQRDLIIALKQKEKYKDELEELKKFLPVGGEAKLKTKTK
jgi:transcriptional regulator with XRE-family HTH domain